MKRLSSQRRHRLEEGRFVVEGPKMINEALAAGVTPEVVYVDSAGARAEIWGLSERCEAAGSEVLVLQPGVLARACDSVTPQPVAAVVANLDRPLADLRDARPGLIVVGVGLQDPGNAGALVRSAAASGAAGVIFAAGCVDVYNPKAVRATAGTLFKVRLSIGEPALAIAEELRRWGLELFATVPRGGRPCWEVDLTCPSAVMVGGEAGGLPSEVQRAVPGRVTIPMSAGVESLNVAMAATVICFEAARQRSATNRA